MPPSQITSHTAAALERLVQQFQDKQSVRDLTAALTGTAQGVESALWQLLTERTLDQAIGAQLDVLGQMVGQERAALGDADYRRFIRARIATNRSRGTVENVLTVMRLVLNEPTADLILLQQVIATFVLRVEGVVVDDELAETVLVQFLRDVAAAGVRGILEYDPTDASPIFTWDVAGQGWDNAHFLTAID